MLHNRVNKMLMWICIGFKGWVLTLTRLSVWASSLTTWDVKITKLRSTIQLISKFSPKSSTHQIIKFSTRCLQKFQHYFLRRVWLNCRTSQRAINFHRLDFTSRSSIFSSKAGANQLSSPCLQAGVSQLSQVSVYRLVSTSWIKFQFSNGFAVKLLPERVIDSHEEYEASERAVPFKFVSLFFHPSYRGDF